MNQEKKKKQGKKIYLTSKDYILEISVREPRQGMSEPFRTQGNKTMSMQLNTKE